MWQLSVLLLVATASAQIPSLGWCPDYQPMANFNINRFLGNWFEEERYFTVSELGTRCVNTKYESTPEGRIIVSNEITNSLTGMKRVLEGTLQMIGREGEGRMVIKYASLPVPYDNEFVILDTDYDNYAVMWACSGVGPVHIQNAWILTRERLPTPLLMQNAYGVLDRFKISRTFFVKTNQADCNILPQPAAEPLDLKNDVIIDAKNAVPELKAEAVGSEKILVRSAIPEVMEPAKPMNMPEAEKKDEKMEKPMEIKEEMIKKEDMLKKDDMMKKDDMIKEEIMIKEDMKKEEMIKEEMKKKEEIKKEVMEKKEKAKRPS
ncbi:unnamed protein product [Pieris macdunnoughi]|uniref:Lipocalin/cytosolic fatty-acid binding domain-containing protein n=1 Tax=Pieris macdunnoughi TaxID=345717 RepID=A0A821SQ83_9NEOP|nr:unnamed protein product [Pieris macdunnoughi]